MDQTIIHSPFTDKFLWFPPEQHPIVCQLGGSDPVLLARAAQIVERYGYDEINLNCGEPILGGWSNCISSALLDLSCADLTQDAQAIVWPGRAALVPH